MPIANCFIQGSLVRTADFKKLVSEWSSSINIDEKDITLNVISDHEQYGQNYATLISLYLPSLWSSADVENIQKSLSDLFVKHLQVSPNDIFIMTSIIESGKVFTNGKTEKWD